MIVSDVGRTTSGSSSADSGSGITACAPVLPVALSRVCVTSATSFAKPSTCSASFARKLIGSHGQGPCRSPRRGELQLLADGRRTKAVLDRDAQIPQPVRELQHRGHVLAAHRY